MSTGPPRPARCGVEYGGDDFSDVKNLNGLTDPDGAEYRLWSDEERLGTYDDGDYIPGFGWPLARDDDDAWVLPGNQSPAQPALVDGQYYGHITNQYYLTRHGYDWVAQSIAHGGLNAMAIVVHYGTNYNNAFWHEGTGAVFFGDGDQAIFRELVSLDVLGHELTHGVTDFTSNLIYQNESGALNEAFSDIMAANIEFYTQANSLEPSPNLTADWFVGEDIYIPEMDALAPAAPGFRNMADPEEDGDPDHYSERYTGTGDNGGVHTNSGIPNHAYYLLVEGGLNASCASSGDHNSLHCTGLEPVTGIDPADAEAIFFLAFTSLGSNATFCDALAATEAVAAGVGIQQLSSTLAAWEAVGLDDEVCGPAPNSPPDAVDDSASTPMGAAVVIDVLDNDSDPDGDSLSITGLTQPTYGSVTKNVAGTIITYTPDGTLGTHSFDYTISDGNGGSDTATVTVTVIDPTQDNLPTVTMTEPTVGSTIGGKRVKLRANAGDDIGVTRVEFRLDGELIGTDNYGSDGWLFRWDSRGTSNGTYVMTAVATDTTGQETTSAAVSVTIDNGSGGGGGGGGGGCKGKNPKCTQ